MYTSQLLDLEIAVKDLLNCLGWGVQMRLQKHTFCIRTAFKPCIYTVLSDVYLIFYIVVGQSMVVCHGLVSYENVATFFFYKDFIFCWRQVDTLAGVHLVLGTQAQLFLTQKYGSIILCVVNLPQYNPHGTRSLWERTLTMQHYQLHIQNALVFNALIIKPFILFADLDEARGCSTNTAVVDKLTE